MIHPVHGTYARYLTHPLLLMLRYPIVLNKKKIKICTVKTVAVVEERTLLTSRYRTL